MATKIVEVTHWHSIDDLIILVFDKKPGTSKANEIGSFYNFKFIALRNDIDINTLTVSKINILLKYASFSTAINTKLHKTVKAFQVNI